MILAVKKIWITDIYTGSIITHGFDSFFSNPNSLGIASILSLVISIYLFLSTKSTALKTFNIINIALQIISLTLSNCRSAYLVIISLCFVYLYIYVKNNYFRFTFILIPISLFSFIVTFYLDKLDAILSGRQAYWSAAFSLISENPFSGVGNSNLIPLIKDFKPKYAEALDIGGLHNIYVEVAATNGLIALLLILFFLSLLFFILVKKIDHCEAKEKLQYTTLLGLYLGIILINLLETNLVYGITFINILFWIYSGYLFSILNKNRYS